MPRSQISKEAMPRPAAIKPINLDTEESMTQEETPVVVEPESEEPMVQEPMAQEPIFVDHFNVTQRRFLAENFKDALVNSSPQGEDYFKRLGPTVQAVMREAVQFTCLYKPLKGKITHEKLDDGSEREFVTIEMEVYQPCTHDKILLHRKFSKSYLDNQ